MKDDALLKQFHKDQKGLSLIELLVAISVSVIVFGLVTAFMTSGLRSFNRQSNAINLQNELQEANNAVTDALQEANTIKEINGAGANGFYTIELDTYTIEAEAIIFDSENTYKCIFYNPENTSLYVLDATGWQNKEAGKSIEAYAYSRFVTEFNLVKEEKAQNGSEIITVHIKVQGPTEPQYLENDLKIATRNRIN